MNSDLLIIALATWRLSYMLVYERGVFDLFETLRFILKATPSRCDTDGNHVLCCVYCTSVWVAPALYVLAEVHEIGLHICAILALSAVAILVHEGIQWMKR